MWTININILSKYQSLCIIILTVIFVATNSQQAKALTAGDVLNKMNAEQQNSYLAGLVGGFAYSRYLRDKPIQTGMNCIYDWYHKGGIKNQRRINAWFDRHQDKPAEPLLFVLIKKECGE